MKSQGFTLVEMVIVVAILGIALGLGVPGYTQWIRNVQIRNQAESIQTGLMKARNEALRRNTNVSFWLVKTTDPKILDSSCALYTAADAATTGISWVISINSPAGLCDTAISETTAPIILAKGIAANGGANATLSTSPSGAYAVTFNGLGQVTVQVATGASLTQLDIAGNDPVAGDKNYRVTLNGGGMIKFCDPSITTNTDSRRC